MVVVGLIVSPSADRSLMSSRDADAREVASDAMIRIFVTGGTFDKTYDEIRGRLSFARHAPAGDAAAGRSRVT